MVSAQFCSSSEQNWFAIGINLASISLCIRPLHSAGAGVDRDPWQDSSAVTQYMSSYVARQDKIKDQALQYVYQIMEEDIEELVKCAQGPNR